MKWYRMYSEARNDAKLRALTDGQHRVWFNLLCLAGEQVQRGILTGYDDELLAVEVANGDVGLLQETLTKLEKLRMIIRNEQEIAFSNWEKRQYDNPSDRPKSVSERVKKHREKTKSNDMKRPKAQGETIGNDNVTICNDSVTSGNTLYTDTESDTNTDTEEKELLPPIPSTIQNHEPIVVVVGDRNLPVYKSVLDQYKHYFVYEPNLSIIERLHSYLDDGVQMDLIAWVMRYAAEKAKGWDYAKGTLENMFIQGVRNAEQAEQANQEYLRQQAVKKVVPIRGSHPREDQLPASVQKQKEMESSGAFEAKGKKIADDPELSKMLSNLNGKRAAGK